MHCHVCRIIPLHGRSPSEALARLPCASHLSDKFLVRPMERTMNRPSSVRVARLVCLGVALFFSISQLAFSQTETILHSFGVVPNDGIRPQAGLVRDAKGNLFGVTAIGGSHLCGRKNQCGTVFEITARGQYKTLYDFAGGANDVGFPNGELTLDAAGNLYGVAAAGGLHGYGAIFKLTPTGSITYLHFLKPADGAPAGGKLLLDAKGNLYGTGSSGPKHCGTIFVLTKSSQFHVLHVFDGTKEGCYPGDLAMDANGNLYGVTVFGTGTALGILYELTPGGKLVVLHSFQYDAGGASPVSPVYVDSTGTVYGLTNDGGSFLGNCGVYLGGCGVVYSISSGNYKVLHSFTGGADGADPVRGLISDGKGKLYGSTWLGGNLTACINGNVALGCGVVFQMSTAGNETVLYEFQGASTDGSTPDGLLVLDKAGNLYGTTLVGGASDLGTVFKIR